MNRLILSKDMWESLKNHLFSDDCEHLAFIFAEPTGTDKGVTFLGRELLLVPDTDLHGESSWDGLSLKLNPLLEVMNKASKLNCIFVEAHSHPFSNTNVEFSRIDMRGQREMAEYLEDLFPGRPYLALVLGRNSVQGHIWQSGLTTPEKLDEVRVIGPAVHRYGKQPDNTNEHSRNTLNSAGSDIYHRQVLALGVAGQSKIHSTKVGIVGLGGIGSIVSQQLAYLGTRDYVLIDDDIVEPTNLNRLATACSQDLGLPKVEVAQQFIRKVSPTSAAKPICANVRTIEAINALQTCDVIFGCMDTDSGRLILNELCIAYMIPYVDCGVGINLAKGRIIEAGGRVTVWTPERPCLLCSQEINVRIAAEELESAQEREFRKQHGYISGADIPEPAVISLNGTVASLAITEFIALVTGFRASFHYTYYDMLEQRVGQRKVSKDQRCTTCASQGLGHKANLARYHRVGLPKDIPRS